MAKQRKPKFEESNRHVLQISFNGKTWDDYASIKTPGDMSSAISKVDAGTHVVNLEGLTASFRIVRRFMGTEVVYVSK